MRHLGSFAFLKSSDSNYATSKLKNRLQRHSLAVERKGAILSPARASELISLCFQKHLQKQPAASSEWCRQQSSSAALSHCDGPL